MFSTGWASIREHLWQHWLLSQLAYILLSEKNRRAGMMTIRVKYSDHRTILQNRSKPFPRSNRSKPFAKLFHAHKRCKQLFICRTIFQIVRSRLQNCSTLTKGANDFSASYEGCQTIINLRDFPKNKIPGMQVGAPHKVGSAPLHPPYIFCIGYLCTGQKMNFGSEMP